MLLLVVVCVVGIGCVLVIVIVVLVVWCLWCDGFCVSRLFLFGCSVCIFMLLVLCWVMFRCIVVV